MTKTHLCLALFRKCKTRHDGIYDEGSECLKSYFSDNSNNWYVSRISRLIINYILDKYDYPLLLIKNTDRKAYFKALEKSQIEEENIHFKKWFMKYYIKQIM
jgi:hypothetical protein